jgi:hypothetical protein
MYLQGGMEEGWKRNTPGICPRIPHLSPTISNTAKPNNPIPNLVQFNESHAQLPIHLQAIDMS